MRAAWKWLAVLGLGGLGVLGCAERAKRPLIIPPKEEFHVPPEGSPAFSGPVKYPKDLLNNVQPRRQKDDEPKFGAPGSANGPAMGGSMGLPGAQ